MRYTVEHRWDGECKTGWLRSNNHNDFTDLHDAVRYAWKISQDLLESRTARWRVIDQDRNVVFCGTNSDGCTGNKKMMAKMGLESELGV